MQTQLYKEVVFSLHCQRGAEDGNILVFTSSVHCLTLWPSSLKKGQLPLLMAPKVSMTIGMKEWLGPKLVYFGLPPLSLVSGSSLYCWWHSSGKTGKVCLGKRFDILPWDSCHTIWLVRPRHDGSSLKGCMLLSKLCV